MPNNAFQTFSKDYVADNPLSTEEKLNGAKDVRPSRMRDLDKIFREPASRYKKPRFYNQVG